MQLDKIDQTFLNSSLEVQKGTLIFFSMQTIRDSPDGKPTNHEDEIPLGVSTPIDGNSLDSNAILNVNTNFPQSILNDKHEPSESSYRKNESGNSEGWLTMVSDKSARNLY